MMFAMNTLVLRDRLIAASHLSRYFPARPTNGSPCWSSLAPGASPITMTCGFRTPTPGTAWVRVADNPQAVHERTSAATASRSRARLAWSCGVAGGRAAGAGGGGGGVGALCVGALWVGAGAAGAGDAGFPARGARAGGGGGGEEAGGAGGSDLLVPAEEAESD